MVAVRVLEIHAVGQAMIRGMVYLRPGAEFVRQAGRDQDPRDSWGARLVTALESEGVRAVSIFGRAVRFVFHKDVSGEESEEACRRVLKAVQKVT